MRAPEATAAAVQDAAATPKREEIAAAAAEAHPEPFRSPSQAAEPQGREGQTPRLDISIETAKGNTRPGGTLRSQRTMAGSSARAAPTATTSMSMSETIPTAPAPS